MTQNHALKEPARSDEKKFSFYKSIIHLFLSKKIKNGRLVIHHDGQVYSYGNPNELPKGIIQVKNGKFFERFIKHSEVGFGESYVAKEWETPCLEDLYLVLCLNYKTLLSSSGFFSKTAIKLRHFLSSYKVISFTQSDSQKGMSISYDVGNDFFRLTLGETMTYTCAIFKDKNTSLEEAQEHKIDVIVKKVQPSPGHKVLDIGCGWGTLLKAFQQKHKCEIRGVALAKEQINFCKQNIKGGVFDYLDYRDLREQDHYDRVVSVGMIEHVGQENLQTYAEKVAQVLKPGGRALLHTMIKGSNYHRDPSKQKDMIYFGGKYLMPVSYVPHDFELTDALLKTGKFRILHQEKFGIHYAETIRRWVKNLLDHSEEISRLYSPEHVRCYEYAWTSLGAAFGSGCIDLFQVLVEKSPATRDLSVYDPR